LWPRNPAQKCGNETHLAGYSISSSLDDGKFDALCVVLVVSQLLLVATHEQRELPIAVDNTAFAERQVVNSLTMFDRL
jgi:hypothetical protein